MTSFSCFFVSDLRYIWRGLRQIDVIHNKWKHHLPV